MSNSKYYYIAVIKPNQQNFYQSMIGRSSLPEVFLGKGVLKICSKFTGKHPCRSLISINLFCYLIEITIRHGCCPVNLLHIFRRPFYNNTSGGLFLGKKTAIFICITGCSTGLVSKSISGSLKIRCFFQ